MSKADGQAGAISGDQNVILRVALPRNSWRAEPLGERVFRLSSYFDHAVLVSVGSRQFSLPEHALEKGRADLRLATGVCVSLADYAQGVGIVLVALANNELLRACFEIG